MPSAAPMAVPRTIAPIDCRKSSALGRSRPIAWRTTSRVSVWSRLRRISAMPNMPIASTEKSMPSDRKLRPKVILSWPVSRSVPTVESRIPSRIIAIALRIEPRASTTAKTRPITMSEKYSAGPKTSASRVSGAARAAIDRGAGPGEEGPDRRDAEGHARAPLARHLVAVERRDHGGGLARNVDEDGRGGAAVLGTVIDARQHDERPDRIDPEGDREQHRDGGDWPDARQNANQSANEAANERQREVLQ